MRILTLCKRQYTGCDLLDDRYGRLHEVPAGLARLGHEVTVLASSYRRRGPVDRSEEGVHWIGVDALPWPGSVVSRWLEVARAFRPEVVLASSDALQLVGGEWLARRLGVPVVLDFYDDYEAFALTRFPGLRSALRVATTRASACVAISHSLAEILGVRTPAARLVGVIGNGIPDGFVPTLTRPAARAELGLPAGSPLVGITGALSASRGIEVLFGAVARLQQDRPELRLVVAGARDRGIEARFPRGTIDLGLISHDRVARVLRAVDVGVICNRDSAFARSCHPMKLVEMAACGLPAVAADLGEVSRLLADRPDARYPPGDAITLAERISVQLDHPRPLDAALAESWSTLAQRFAAVIERVAGADPVRH